MAEKILLLTTFRLGPSSWLSQHRRPFFLGPFVVAQSDIWTLPYVRTDKKTCQ